MRERILLGLAVVLLFGGLVVWTVNARRGRVDDDARRYAQSMREPPPLGVDLHPADPRAAAAADAFRRAGLGDAPLRLLFERDHRAVVGVGVLASDALEVWTQLRAVSGETHLWPVILGDGFALAAHADAAAHTSTTVDGVLRRAAALDVDAWLATRPAPPDGTVVPVAGRDERYETLLDPVLHLPVLDVAIALLPIARGADAPAWLAFGNWQGCPDAAVHVAVLRRLEDRAHVELVAVGLDRIELRVPSPPTDLAERDALASLLGRYAPDALARDRATIATWSGTLVPSRSWSLFFPRPL